MNKEKLSIMSAVRSLLSVNMGLQPAERLLVLGDTAGDGGELAREVGEIAERIHPLTRTLIYDPVGGHGQEPPVPVWEAALGEEIVERLHLEGLLHPLLVKEGTGDVAEKAVDVLTGKPVRADVVVAVTQYSISHTSFRKLLTRACGVRFASMPLFERDMFFGAMAVDWDGLAVSTNVLARSLQGADRCEVSSGNGTRILFEVSGRPVLADDGILRQAGAFGNLPAGEVFLAPVEGTAEGTLVLEWGPMAVFRHPLTVTVEKGRVASIRGDSPVDVQWLEKALAAHPDNANIAELGIGTNPAATRPDNVLESEKILGSVHVAFGDNHTFGGRVKAPFHQDFVIFDATLVAVWECGGGRRVLLTEGKKGW